MLAALALASGVAGCKPPPTDAAAARAATVAPVRTASAPLPSPDTTGAIWTQSGAPLRLVYGIPGKPVLIALECLRPGAPTAQIRITRHAPADIGAGALMAVIGNRMIGRFEVDATAIAGRVLWQGEAAASDPGWEALTGDREATVTVPGAGLVMLNPSPLPRQLVTACRSPQMPGVPEDPA
jgi:hypothetical protein